MFWSPAVTRFNVTCCCAAPGWASASRAAMTAAIPMIFCMCPPLLRCSASTRIEVQHAARQSNPHRVALREAARIVDEILLGPNPHRVAVEPAGIGRLGDLAAQYE